MLSILIPAYQYNTDDLIRELVQQCERVDGMVEIRICDDHSPTPVITFSEFESCSFLHVHRNAVNKGRTATRQWLAAQAQFKHILFMDADVMPARPDFVSAFLQVINGAQLCFGGIIYRPEPPEPSRRLRWKYGHKREALSLDSRSDQPYSSINSGCFSIERDLFLDLSKQLDKPRYGMDIYFKQLLAEGHVSVMHFENPVYHLGLESAEAFIDKSLQSVATTVSLEQQGLLQDRSRPLQQGYDKLERLGMTAFFVWLMNLLSTRMERNFRSKRPNLFWFDLYRLNHYIALKKN